MKDETKRPDEPDEEKNEIKAELNDESPESHGFLDRLKARLYSAFDDNTDRPSFDYDEFTSFEQRRSIRGALKTRIMQSKLRVLLLLLLFAASVVIDLIPAIMPGIIPDLAASHVRVFYIINLSFMAIAFAISINSILCGIAGFFRRRDPGDCASSAVFLVVALHTLLAFFFPDMFDSPQTFVPFALLALLLSQLNRVKIYNRIYINFAFVSRDENKYASRVIDYPLIRKELYRSFIGENLAAGSTKTRFMSGFFENSLQSNPCEKSAKRISILVVAFILIVLLVLSSSQSSGLSAGSALYISVCAVCLCMPLYSSCVSNAALYKKSRLMRKKFGMIGGFSAAAELGRANSVILDARELYPGSKVRLVGMKTFSGERIDQVLSDSAALVLEANWPLAPAFEQIIGNRYNILPRIDSLTIKNEHGLTGWVKGRRVIIGSASLISSYGIVPPSKDFEDRYIKDGQSVIYLASAGELAAMFVVQYEPDKKTAKKLRFLTENGVTLLVRTSDPNVTIKMISDGFGISSDSVKLLSVEAGEEYEKLRHRATDSEPALAAGSEDNDFLLDSVIAAKRILISNSLVRAVQRIACVLGMIMAAFLALYGGISQIGPAQIAAYQCFWGLIVAAASVWKTL